MNTKHRGAPPHTPALSPAGQQRRLRSGGGGRGRALAGKANPGVGRRSRPTPAKVKVNGVARHLGGAGAARRAAGLSPPERSRWCL